MKVSLPSTALFLVATLFAAFTVYAENGTPCHTIVSTYDTVPSQYATPINLFGTRHESMITVACNDGVTNVQVGSGASSQYIYKYGYHRVDGDWKKVTFTGSNTVQSWIVGSASAEIESVEEGETGKVIAYICQKVSGAWKCGCRDKACTKAKWNLQTYTATKKEENESTYKTPSQNDLAALKEETIGSEDDVLDVHYPSAYIGLPGDTIELYGSGFKKTAVNNILWNGEKKQTIASSNGGVLEITIPEDEPGKYEVEVEVQGTRSKYNTVIWIGTGTNRSPSIMYVTPQVGDQGDTYTIHGSGFTPENNDIITTFGILTGLSSEDGNTITFVYNPFDKELISYNTSGERSHQKAPVHVTVVNTSGVSNSEIFELRF